MKLATALNERADLQKRLEKLSARLADNAKVQEGDEPAEAPEELLREVDESAARLEELMARINRTNAETRVDGASISDLLARRDCLRLKLRILRDFLHAASSKVERFSRTEIRISSTVDVKKMQKQVDELAAQLRQTDEKLQELNWLTELL